MLTLAYDSIPVHEFAALGTALCWAITGLIGFLPSNYLGAFAYSRLRQLSVAVLLALFVLATGRWLVPPTDQLLLLLLSGFIGIFLGDTLLFITLNRLGPRRTGLLFALNAPITALLGWLVLGEQLALVAIAGIACTTFGVMLAVMFRKNDDQAHALEQVTGALWIGVCFGLLSALGQSVGSLIMRPLMQAGIDPFAASMFRVAIAALCLSTLMALPIPAVKPKAPLNWKMAGLTILAGVNAMGIGMTLLLFALAGGKTGIVSSLSATSPALFLPILWIYSGQRPAAGAWVGAAFVVVGIALIFLSK